MGGGGTSTNTVVNPPTPEQTALTNKQIQLAEQQLKAIEKQTGFQEKLFANAEPLFDMQSEVFKNLLADINDPTQKALKDAQTQFAIESIPIQRELQQKQLEAIRRNGAASPEELELIKQATEAGISTGWSDIDRASREGMESLKDFASASGFRTSDSPILDRGQKLQAEALRGKTDLATSLRGAEATAKLNFPLARDQLLAGMTGAQQQITMAAQQFQAALRDASLNARLKFSSAANDQIFGAAQGNLGIAGAAGGGISSLGAAIAPLNNSRGTTTTQTSSPGFMSLLQPAGSFLGGVGGLVSGIGSVIGSSRTFKEGNAKLDFAAVLRAIEDMPVEAWRYKPEMGLGTEQHVGTYAEDFRKATGLGDGKTIPVIDAIGLVMAGLKGLKSKVDELEDFAFARA